MLDFQPPKKDQTKNWQPSTLVLLKCLAAFSVLGCLLGSVGAALSGPFAARSPPTCGCSAQLEALEERLRHEFSQKLQDIRECTGCISPSPPPPSPSPSPPSPPSPPLHIVNNCGFEGRMAVPDEYMVNLKLQHPSQSEGRRSDTREDKLSYLKSFVHRYFGTADLAADDHEVDTSNAAATAESSYTYDVDSEPAVFYFPELLAFSIHASEQVILFMAKDPAVSRIQRNCFIPAPNDLITH